MLIQTVKKKVHLFDSKKVNELIMSYIKKAEMLICHMWYISVSLILYNIKKNEIKYFAFMR